MNSASLFLLIPVIFWGVSYIAIKIVLDQLSPMEMISGRFFLGTITLYLILRFKKISPWPVHGIGKLFAAAFMVFLHFWVMAEGMKDTSASNTAWILTTAPIFIAILSWIVLKEVFSLSQWGGLLIAGSGVLFLTYNGDANNFQWTNSKGDLLVLGSCVTWAIYTVGTRGITQKIHPLVATFWMTALAGLIFIPITLFSSGIQPYLTMQTDTTVALLFLGICALAISFWLWSEGLARQTAAEVGVWLYIEPIITVIGAWFLLGEAITVWLAIGAALISLGVFIAEKYGHAKPVEHDA